MKMALRIGAIASLLLSVGVCQAKPGTHASVEWLLLAPKVNSTGFDQIFYDGAAIGIETEGNLNAGLESGVRFIVGQESCDGLGVQFRYFHFENESGYSGTWDGGTPIAINGFIDVEVDALDFEVSQRASFCCWDLVVSGGLRYASAEISQGGGLFAGVPAVVFGGPTGVEFTGVGPTFALSAQRKIGCRGFSIIGNVRTALLFGDIDQRFAFRTPFTGTISDEFVQVTEMQFGLGYDRCLCSGKNLELAILWEAQRWDSDSNYLGDLALHGLSLKAGLSF